MKKIRMLKEVDCGHAHLTSQDIEECRENLEDLIIAPYDSSHAKGIGYNLALSEMIYSIIRKRLVPICRDSQEVYFWLRPNETVLALSYEYVKVSNNIAGSLHSRVRTTAQGIGNVSTTLDPGWNGMFLFSLNNPTCKKIKVIISSRIEGIMKPNPIITLIPWRTMKRKEKNVGVDFPKLNIDNPPMRVDVWSELTSEPLRLFRNRQYQDFCKLVTVISEYQATPLEGYEWTEELSKLITELEIGIKNQDNKIITATLINIKNIPYRCAPIQKLISCLVLALDQDNKISFCNSLKYISKIELLQREIQYQLLCGQVEKIHSTIRELVPKSWKRNILANIWHFTLRNIGFIILTIITVILISYGTSVNDSDYWSKLVLALAPLAISIIFGMVSKIKNG